MVTTKRAPALADPVGDTRQQVLVLYLVDSALDSAVVGWSVYDAASEESPETGDHSERPFATGLDAMRAGWRLINAAPLRPAAPGMEYTTSFQKFEFFFERLVPVHAEERTAP